MMNTLKHTKVEQVMVPYRKTVPVLLGSNNLVTLRLVEYMSSMREHQDNIYKVTLLDGTVQYWKSGEEVEYAAN